MLYHGRETKLYMKNYLIFNGSRTVKLTDNHLSHNDVYIIITLKIIFLNVKMINTKKYLKFYFELLR